MNSLTLSTTTPDDLKVLVEFQLNEEAKHLAAFNCIGEEERMAFLEKYGRFLNDPTIIMKTIRWDGRIVGSISRFFIGDEAEITYWIDRKYWGQGIATRALMELLIIDSIRPIYGRVAFDNFGSQKVLERCGFVRIGADRGFSNARQTEIEEFIYKLS